MLKKLWLWVGLFSLAMFTAPLNVVGAPEAPGTSKKPAERVSATLKLPQMSGIGRTVIAEIILQHDSSWHTYGPAEVGATTLEWTLPKGWTVGEIQWPNQENFMLQGISSWGYTGTITLKVPLKTTALATPGEVAQVSVRAEWIVCGQGMCVPGGATLNATTTLVKGGPVEATVSKMTMGLDWKIILGAFAGGLILNLMPCVFPVLGIKILSFIKNSGESRKKVVQQSMAYGVGIIASAIILGVIIVALRGGGAAIGWGFQLQDARVVWAIVAVLMLFAMNMAGGWELPSWGGNVQGKADKAGGLLGAFGSGALMVAVATPCSAPFLAVAIGSIFILPAWQAIAVMAVMGLGMALPYWLLAAYPNAVKKLPKPGQWMEDLKKILAWVMAAAALYQAWVYVGQVSPEESLKGLMGLLVVLAGAWAVTHWKKLGRIIGLALVVLGAWMGLWSHTPAITWEAWSPTRVSELRGQGRTVVVDFTARWCVNCLINERVVWDNKEIQALVKKKNIALLKADWTKRDETIAAELRRRGLAAVPLIVIYKDGGPEKGLELPNLLSVAQVRAALE